MKNVTRQERYLNDPCLVKSAERQERQSVKDHRAPRASRAAGHQEPQSVTSAKNTRASRAPEHQEHQGCQKRLGVQARPSAGNSPSLISQALGAFSGNKGANSASSSGGPNQGSPGMVKNFPSPSGTSGPSIRRRTQ